MGPLLQGTVILKCRECVHACEVVLVNSFFLYLCARGQYTDLYEVLQISIDNFVVAARGLYITEIYILALNFQMTVLQV